jgi:2-polyprenyl-3-methyl-5-hydroxy-6-metoxy-1,4-benzoquinol methylase
LDYGCGGGRFVVEALEKGYSVTGAEYNPELVANLSKTFTKASFLTIDDFYKSDAKYDIIFLSNVLEHLTNPKEIMLKLRERVSENGLFVLEGPVENNFNLTLFTRKIIFFIRKNFFGKKASHTPTHILYANRKNQEQFLKDIG